MEREERSFREWLEHMIEPAVRRAWIDAGLGAGDLRLVEQCVAFGPTPEHLAIAATAHGPVIGSTVSGSVGSIVARLRESGHLANTA